MKHSKFILFILFSILFLSSCDKIEPPFTTINNNNNGGTDTVRKVLLEDFSGHRCINCPTAHAIAKDLKTLYGKQLILLVTHATYFSQPQPTGNFTYDFRVTEGLAWAALFGANNAPIGMVNRIDHAGSKLLDRGDFATEVSKLIDSLPKWPEAYIYLQSNFNSSDSTVSVNADVTFLSSMPSGKYNLTLVISESEFIKPQSNNNPLVGLTPEILNYSHNHFLRGVLTTTWGDEIKNGAPTLNEKISKNIANYKMGKDWNPANCHVIAFLTYADGIKQYEVIQAQEIKLK